MWVEKNGESRLVVRVRERKALKGGWAGGLAGALDRERRSHKEGCRD